MYVRNHTRGENTMVKAVIFDLDETYLIGAMTVDQMCLMIFRRVL
jgi:FMN phosphatase YigB (HAD superfamily)